MNPKHRLVSPFGWALLTSVLLHLAVIGNVVHWRCPLANTAVALPPPLELHLAAAADTAAPAASPIAPARRALPTPAAPAPAAPVPPPAVENTLSAVLPEPMLTVPPPDPMTIAPTLPAAPTPPSAARRLPQSGTLSYRFFWGKARWLAGEASQQWLIEDDRYTLSSTVTTTGLFGLLRPFHMVETAKGNVVGDRLRPLQFTMQLNNDMRMVAMFNWEKGYFRWYDGRVANTQPLPANSYDKISLLFQLYIDRGIERLAALHLSLGRRLEASVVEDRGLEEVDIDGTAHVARHLHRPGSAADPGAVDIWLSHAYGLPVKMSYANGNEVYFEQVITADSLPVAATPPRD